MRRLLPLFAVMSLVACAASEPLKEDRAGDTERSSRASSAVQGAAPPPAPAASAPPSVRVDLDRSLGHPTAPLALVEFADYQCPYCRVFHLGTLPKLKAAYIDTGKVRYFYKDFPLSNHAHALPASVAAYCAGNQGRYWEMQDLLYAKQARLGDELYGQLAEELKLDAEQFRACLASNPPRRAVRRDLDEGRRLGITGTPSFVLGRLEGDRVVVERLAVGGPPFEVFAREIEALSR